MLLGSTLENIAPSWGNLGAIFEALGATWVFLGAILGNPGAILGLAWDDLGATWVQGHLVEMQKSLPLGPCAAKSLAPEHTSSTITSCEMEIVDFTLVLYAFLNICIRVRNVVNLELSSFIYCFCHFQGAITSSWRT